MHKNRLGSSDITVGRTQALYTHALVSCANIPGKKRRLHSFYLSSTIVEIRMRWAQGKRGQENLFRPINTHTTQKATKEGIVQKLLNL